MGGVWTLGSAIAFTDMRLRFALQPSAVPNLLCGHIIQLQNNNEVTIEY